MPQNEKYIYHANIAVILALGFLCLVDSNVQGKDGPVNWRFYQTQDGMEESYCSFASVSPRGRIWVAHGSTKDVSWLDGWPGLDGKLIHRFLAPGYFWPVRESEEGQLWSVNQQGIMLVKDNSWLTYEVKEKYFPSLYMYPVKNYPFLPGVTNQVYYLEKQVLILFDASSQQMIELIVAGETGIGSFHDMIYAHDGSIWITGEKGILNYNPEAPNPGQAWQEYYPPWQYYEQFFAPVAGENGDLYVVAFNRNTNINELLVLQDGQWSKKKDHSGSVVKGWPGLEGSYWVLKEDEKLFQIKQGMGEMRVNDGILATKINNVTVESDDVFWVATQTGLARYTPALWRTPVSLQDRDCDVIAICEDEEGRIWLLSQEALFMYDDDQWFSYELPRPNRIPDQQEISLFPLADGKIGFREYGGMGPLVFDPETKEFSRIVYSDPDKSAKYSMVTTVVSSSNHWLWFITYSNYAPDSVIQRLELYDSGTFETVYEFAFPYETRYLHECSNGDIWISSNMHEYGIAVIRDGEYKLFGPDDGFNGGGVFCISEFEDGSIWTGGRNEIYAYDGKQWSLVRNEGLDNVFSIHKSRDGSVWIASTTGIHRFRDNIWVTYSSDDGLPNSSSNCIFEDSQGRVWAGTSQGVGLYHPEADTYPPETFFHERDKLDEVPPSGNAKIIFSGVDRWDHTGPDKLFFSYRIDNSEWSPFKSGNTVWFSDLAHGTHLFEVRAMDLNLNIDHYPAKLDFTVLLPWYKETGFIIIISISGVIITILLGYALHRHFALESLVSQRTDDLQWTNIKLLRSLRHEKLLADIASIFNARSGFYENLEDFLALLGDGIEISGVCLFEIDEKDNYLNLGEWRCKSSGIETGKIQFLPKLKLKNLVTRIGEGYYYSFSNLNGLNAAEANFFQGKKIRSASMVPVRTAEKTMGCLSFFRYDEYEWSNDEQKLFSTIAGMLANIWERHKHLQARLFAERKQTEALKVVEQASRMASIGVISAGIAHEINQPLNDISVITDSILFWNEQNRGLIPQKYRTWLQSISDRVNRITEIIKQMRSYWISLSNKEEEEINLNQAVSEAVSLISSQLASHKIKLEIVESDEDILLKGNKINLEQIVINLVINAMHALDTQEKTDKRITVTISRKGRYINLEVHDNGPGLPNVEANKLFDPFFTTKGEDLGMGLGLAIVKRFVERFCGKVKACNGQDGGASFLVEIPVHSQNSSE